MLGVAGDLNLAAARLTTAAGADTVLDAHGGTLRVAAATTATAALPQLELGGSLALRGRDIDYAGAAILPSGRFTLEAERAINLGGNGLIDVSGVPVVAAGHTVQSSAGYIRLLAGTTVDAAAGTSLLASAQQDADAGSISIRSAGTTSLAGTLRATTGTGRGGIFELDAGSIAGFSSLQSRLESGGFRERRSLHAATGDLDFTAGSTNTARVLEYSTDAGSIHVTGNLVATSAAVGRGAIRLFGGAGVTLAAGGSLQANGSASSQRGGLVEVGTSTGVVNLDAGGMVSATGSEQGR